MLDGSEYVADLGKDLPPNRTGVEVGALRRGVAINSLEVAGKFTHKLVPA